MANRTKKTNVTTNPAPASATVPAVGGLALDNRPASTEPAPAKKGRVTLDEEPAPAQNQQNPATSTPASKEAKTRKPASKKNQPASKDKAPAFSVDIEKNTASIVRVSATTSIDMVSGQLALSHGSKVSEKTIALPKTAKADQRHNFGMLVQGKVFDYIAEDSLSKTASIKDKVSKSESGEPTDEQKNTLESLKDQRATISTLRTKYKVGKSNFVTDMLAQLVACKMVGHKLPIDTSILQNALQCNYTALHDFVVAGINNNSATMTEDQQASVTTCKKALVDTMSVFCKATDWCDQFKLKASTEDVVLFYELSVIKLVDGEPQFIWTNDKDGKAVKELHNALCEWLFRKMKIDIE